MRNYAFLTLFVFLLTGGCGGTDSEISSAKSSGGLALAVGSETITSDEIIDRLTERLRSIAAANDFDGFCEQARGALEDALADKIYNVLLYQEAKRDVGEKIDLALEKGVNSELRKYVAGFGGDYARAKESLKERGMDWDSFKELQKERVLRAFLRPEAKPITYGELLDCYNKMKDEFFTIGGTITLRLIDIEVAKLQVTDANRSRLEQARDLANELMRRIRAGEDFGALASQYSHGYRRDSGGLWKPTRPENLQKPYDILAVKAEKMEPGDIAGPIDSETGWHVFIMKLEDRQDKGFEPLSKVQRKVEQKIIRDRQKQAADELDTGLAEQAALIQSSEFIDFCVKKIYRMSNQ